MEAQNLTPENTDQPFLFSDEIDMLKEALAEAEDMAAEFAMEMRLEAKRLSEKLNREQ